MYEGRNRVFSKEIDLHVNTKGEFFAKLREDTELISYTQMYVEANPELAAVFEKNIRNRYSSKPITEYNLYANSLDALETLLNDIVNYAYSGTKETTLVIRYAFSHAGIYFVRKNGEISNTCCAANCVTDTREECEVEAELVYGGGYLWRFNQSFSIGLSADVVVREEVLSNNGSKRVNYYPLKDSELAKTEDGAVRLNSWRTGWDDYPKGETENDLLRQNWTYLDYSAESALWFCKQFESLAIITNNLKLVFDRDNIEKAIAGNQGLLSLNTAGGNRHE